MPELFVRIPMFGIARKKRREQIKVFKKWFEDEGRRVVRDRYNVYRVDVSYLAPGATLRIPGPGGGEGLEISYPKGTNSRVQKGLAIRLDLIGVLDRVDRFDVTRRHDALFVVIDGSGAFNPSCILDVVDTLSSPPVAVDVAIGQRPATDTGMAPRALSMTLRHQG